MTPAHEESQFPDMGGEIPTEDSYTAALRLITRRYEHLVRQLSILREIDP